MNWRYHLSTKQKLTASRKPFHAHAQGSFLPLDLFCFCVGAKKDILLEGKEGGVRPIFGKVSVKSRGFSFFGGILFCHLGCTILDSSCFRPGKMRRSKEELEKKPWQYKKKTAVKQSFGPLAVSLTDFFDEVLQSFNMKSNSCRYLFRKQSWWRPAVKRFLVVGDLEVNHWISILVTIPCLTYQLALKWLKKGPGPAVSPRTSENQPSKKTGGDMAFPQVLPSDIPTIRCFTTHTHTHRFYVLGFRTPAKSGSPLHLFPFACTCGPVHFVMGVCGFGCFAVSHACRLAFVTSACASNKICPRWYNSLQVLFLTLSKIW